MASFDFDQESGSFIAYSIIKDNHIRLLGQEMTVKGAFLSPWYYYFLVPFYLLTNFNPIGGIIASVLTGIVIIIGYYYLGKRFFGEAGGLTAAFLRSILFEEITHDWSMIPSYACELVVLLTWWSFYKIWKGKLAFYLPFVFFLFGLYAGIYPILFPFYLIFLIMIFILKRKDNLHVSKKNITGAIICFAIPLLPTFIFEFKYDFLQTRRVLAIADSPSTGPSFLRFFYYLNYNLSEISRILNMSWALPTIWAMAFLIIFVFFYKKKETFYKESFHQIILPVCYIVFILSFTLMPTHVSDNYFLPLTTLSLLYISGILSTLIKNPNNFIFYFLIMAGISSTNLKLLREKWSHPNLSGLYHKEKIVEEIGKREDGERPFNVSYIATVGWNFGFRYLFQYYNLQPKYNQPALPTYTIVVPKDLCPDAIDIYYGNVGLILPD
jgi:hypothetical protein